tara:strand:+ start:123 stop:566 length:444 start_codon:yes stop_codon:yes gene_type:complete
MNRKVMQLVERSGGMNWFDFTNEFTYDFWDFYTEETVTETCPECDHEVDIMQNGKSDCPKCGHKEVLPCSNCPLLVMSKCDWNSETRCSAFPKKQEPKMYKVCVMETSRVFYKVEAMSEEDALDNYLDGESYFSKPVQDEPERAWID